MLVDAFKIQNGAGRWFKLVIMRVLVTVFYKRPASKFEICPSSEMCDFSLAKALVPSSLRCMCFLLEKLQVLWLLSERTLTSSDGTACQLVGQRRRFMAERHAYSFHHHGIFFFNWRNGIQTNQLIAKNPIFFGISIVTLAPVPRFSGPCPLPKTNNRLRMIVCLALAEWNSAHSRRQCANKRQKAALVMYKLKMIDFWPHGRRRSKCSFRVTDFPSIRFRLLR